MAIDSASRRLAALGDWTLIPDGTVTLFDRAAMLGDYLPLAAVPRITWSLYADFDRDGTYETDLTSYVTKPGPGVAISRGINPDGMYQVSKFSTQLLNNDGRFSDRNSGSAYYGQMNPDVPMRLTAEYGDAYTMWTGYASSWKRQWRAGAVPMVALECWDIAHYLVDSDVINTTVSTSRDTDGALNAVLDAWEDKDGTDYIPAANRDFDDGVQDLSYHFAIGQKVMDALMAVVRSEPGWLWVKADGTLRFEARNARLGVTPDDTWGDGTGIFPVAIDDLTNDWDYITSVRARASVFSAGQAGQEVFRFQRGAGTSDSLLLASGETYRRTFQLSQAFEALTAPVATTDYLGNTAIDGSGTDRTSSLTVEATALGGGMVTISIKNTHASSVYVTLFRLRAQPVNFFYGDHPETFLELSVAGRPAGKGLEIDKPFTGDGSTYQLANDAMQTLRTYRYAVPRLKLSFVPNSDSAVAKVLALELGDLIRYTDTGITTNGSYTDDWFYVEGLEYHIPPDWAGQSFMVDVTLTPSYVFRDLDKIAWDTFDRDDATGDLGTSDNGVVWANDGSMNIVSSAARASSDSLQMPNLDLGASATDQVVEAIISEIGTGDEVGLVFRYVDADNQYRVYLDKGSNELILEKNVVTVVTEITSPAFTVGTEHELRVIVQGSRIRVWVDHALRIDTTDSALTSGTKVGLFARNASGTAKFNWPYGQRL